MPIDDADITNNCSQNLYRQQFWIIFAAVTAAAIQVAIIITRRSKLFRDRPKPSLFSACDRAWQLPQQRHDDIYRLLLEMLIAGSLIAIGVGVVLWFALTPFLIVAGPSILFVLVSSLLNLVQRRRKCE